VSLSSPFSVLFFCKVSGTVCMILATKVINVYDFFLFRIDIVLEVHD